MYNIKHELGAFGVQIWERGCGKETCQRGRRDGIGARTGHWKGGVSEIQWGGHSIGWDVTKPLRGRWPGDRHSPVWEHFLILTMGRLGRSLLALTFSPSTWEAGKESQRKWRCRTTLTSVPSHISSCSFLCQTYIKHPACSGHWSKVLEKKKTGQTSVPCP